ncbi:hypothetical protein [Nonomuraea sp. NPDC049129]|uniref:Gp37-like protein n=1 Tax=Nonomuraea sp. NPDC049129 TaxID=3155272 RepID=UPI0033C9DCBD
MDSFRIFIRESPFPQNSLIEPLAILGEVTAFTNFEAIVRHNEVGSWTLDVPAQHPQARLLQPGRGFVVFRDDSEVPVTSGPIQKIVRKWSATADSGAGTITVTGVDDNNILAERLAWTRPDADIRLQGATTYWPADRAWKNAGELLHHLITQNTQYAGPRRLPYLFVAPPSPDLRPDDSAHGARLKFDRIDELTRLLASVHGLVVRCLWHPNPASVGSNGDPEASGPGLLVTFAPARDRSDAVHFSVESGNLQSYDYTLAAPDATRLVIGTQNRTWQELEHRDTFDDLGNVNGFTRDFVEKQGPERWFGLYSNRSRDPWWWGNEATTPAEFAYTIPLAQQGLSSIEVEWGSTREAFKDRRDIPWQWAQDTIQPAGWQLDPPSWSAYYRALADEVDSFNRTAGPKAAITIDPVESPRLRYHTHYQVGDFISAHIDGATRRELVSEVRLSLTVSDGPKVTPTLGSYGTSESPYLYKAVKGLWDRVNTLSSREMPEISADEVPTVPFVLRKAA